MRLTFLVALCALSLLLPGCGKQDTERTKQEAAQATQQIKQGAKVAAVELKKDTKEAVQQTKAAAAGVKEGLNSSDPPVNINKATRTQLQTLPGVDEETADRIVDGRPYHTRDEVGTRGVVSPDEFNAIKDKISVK